METGIVSSRSAVFGVTFAREAELDVFGEQRSLRPFVHVLTTAMNLLLEDGFAREAVLAGLQMSGELSYVMAKTAESGLTEQSNLHWHTC